MDQRRRCLWHLDPLTGTPVDKTVNGFKYFIAAQYFIILYVFKLRVLINDINIQTKRLPFTWENWNFKPEKVYICVCGHKRKVHTNISVLLLAATASTK